MASDKVKPLIAHYETTYSTAEDFFKDKTMLAVFHMDAQGRLGFAFMPGTKDKLIAHKEMAIFANSMQVIAQKLLEDLGEPVS